MFQLLIPTTQATMMPLPSQATHKMPAIMMPPITYFIPPPPPITFFIPPPPPTLPLIIILVGVMIVIIVIIAFFTMRNFSDSKTPGAQRSSKTPRVGVH